MVLFWVYGVIYVLMPTLAFLRIVWQTDSRLEAVGVMELGFRRQFQRPRKQAKRGKAGNCCCFYWRSAVARDKDEGGDESESKSKSERERARSN